MACRMLAVWTESWGHEVVKAPGGRVCARRTAQEAVTMARCKEGSMSMPTASPPRFGLGWTAWVIIVAVLLVVLAAMVIRLR
jgi:hypothetical protein